MNKKENLDKQKKSVIVSIRSLSHDGRGIGTINNKTAFVSGALPNETVTCEITQKRSNYQEADATEILTASSERTTPPCAHFGVCGGCSLQHMSVESQMALKQQTLLDQLKHFGQVTPDHLLSPLHAVDLGYRRKARLGVKFVIKKNKMLVGFREKSSRYLADLERCPVLHPSVGEHLQDLAALVQSLEQFQHIPQIEIAIGDTEGALVFRHMHPLSESDQEKLVSFGKNHHFHIYLQPNPPASVYKIWPKNCADRLTYTLPDESLEFLFHPLDFTQVNLDMNRLMVKQALHLLGVEKHETVLDLFCGIGNFTLPLAKYGAHVTGIEGAHEMTQRASDNAKHNGILNVSFYAANLETPPVNAPWINKQYDKILLDPPRAGAKDILPHFKTFSAKKIVYVSCNPATLARDAGELVHVYGYRMTHAGIMNMFPHTSHTEAMAVFEKPS